MIFNGNLSIMLCTQGTYPIHAGGVSTWCGMLCNELQESNYILYSRIGGHVINQLPRLNQIPYSWKRVRLAGYYFLQKRFKLPRNINSIIFSGTTQPHSVRFGECNDNNNRLKREIPDESVICNQFIPMMQNVLGGIYQPRCDLIHISDELVKMWHYFQIYDWRRTWGRKTTLRQFKKVVLASHLHGNYENTNRLKPSRSDIYQAYQMLEKNLMPLNHSLPRTDIVHSTLAGCIGLPGIIYKRLHRTPYILTEHGVYIREKYFAVSKTSLSYFMKQYLMGLATLFSRLNYFNADIIATTSAFNQRWEIKYGARSDQIQQIPNGVGPQICEQKVGISHKVKRPVVISISSLIPIKDILTLIRSAAVACRFIPDILYNIYGSTSIDPDYSRRCLNLIADLDLQDTVFIKGFRQNVLAMHAQSKIVILSSVSESCPFSLLEAMSCGVPVVATNVGSVKDIVADAGIIVPPRDAESLGLAVAKLLKNEKQRLIMGERAREIIRQNYTSSKMVNSYRDLYKEALKSKQSRVRNSIFKTGKDNIMKEELLKKKTSDKEAKLLQRAVQSFGEPLDAMGLAVSLEMLGIRDSNAAATYGKQDVFDLAESMFPGCQSD